MGKHNKGVYAIFIHTAQPLPGGKTQMHEICEFVDRIQNRHTRSATAIVDLKNQKMLKDRTENGTFERYVDYLKSDYPEQFAELITVADLGHLYAGAIDKADNVVDIDDIISMEDITMGEDGVIDIDAKGANITPEIVEQIKQKIMDKVEKDAAAENDTN